MDISLVHSIWTVVVMVLFVGIVLWAWSDRQKQRFDEAARLPFDEDDAPSAELHSKEITHG